MANEELHHRGLLRDGKLKGLPFGRFENINIGSTQLSALVIAGLDAVIPKNVVYPFRSMTLLKKPQMQNRIGFFAYV